jgi:hypothetical protein
MIDDLHRALQNLVVGRFSSHPGQLRQQNLGKFFEGVFSRIGK